MQRKSVCRHPLRFKQIPSFLVAFRQQDICSINDLFRGGLPAILRTCLAIVSRSLSYHLERAIGNAEAEMMTRGYLTGLATASEGVSRWMRLLYRPRPHRDHAEPEVTPLPAKGLWLRPRFEDQIHCLGRALARFRRVETVAQVLAGNAAQQPNYQPAFRQGVQHRQFLGDLHRIAL